MNTGVSPNEYIVTCPWCLDSIIIQEENCKIFRHAAKKTGGQFTTFVPHSVNSSNSYSPSSIRSSHKLIHIYVKKSATDSFVKVLFMVVVNRLR